MVDKIGAARSRFEAYDLLVETIVFALIVIFQELRMVVPRVELLKFQRDRLKRLRLAVFALARIDGVSSWKTVEQVVEGPVFLNDDNNVFDRRSIRRRRNRLLPDRWVDGRFERTAPLGSRPSAGQMSNGSPSIVFI